jgi:hypothetical protein
MRGQFAHHQHAQAAVRQQDTGHLRARDGVGADVGGIDADRRAVGQRHFDELQHRQRHAMPLAADRQLLHTRAGGVGHAGQQAQRSAGADVVQRDELGRVAAEFLLQRLGQIPADEELDLVVRDAPAHVVRPWPR